MRESAARRTAESSLERPLCHRTASIECGVRERSRLGVWLGSQILASGAQVGLLLEGNLGRRWKCLELSTYDWTRMTRQCVSRQEGAEKRTLRAINHKVRGTAGR